MSERSFQRLGVEAIEAWLAQHPGALILDARDPASHGAANLAGSIRIDGRNHEPMLMQTPRDRPVFIYCYRGNASQTYAQQFADFGFKQVAHMEGGWEAWQKRSPATPAAGLPKALAEWLVANGFSGLDTPAAHGNTPLMHAAWKGDLAMVDALLSAGASVTPVNDDGNTALWLGCVSNDPIIVKRLVAAGAALDHANATGATCLMYAASSSKPRIVAELLMLGADPLIQTQDEYTALDMAACVDSLRLLRAATRDERRL